MVVIVAQFYRQGQDVGRAGDDSAHGGVHCWKPGRVIFATPGVYSAQIMHESMYFGQNLALVDCRERVPGHVLLWEPVSSDRDRRSTCPGS